MITTVGKELEWEVNIKEGFFVQRRGRRCVTQISRFVGFLSGFFEKIVNSFSKRRKLVKKLLPERQSDAISTNELRLEDETIFAEN